MSPWSQPAPTQHVDDLLLQQDRRLQLQRELLLVLDEDDDRDDEVEELEEEDEPHEFLVVGFDPHLEILDFILDFVVLGDGNSELDFLVVQVEDVGQVHLVPQRHELAVNRLPC